ncbi:hypothetical protein TorRG33x02_339630 [Trema orientale]|uniref:Uncharacterized protein n=1 Tax=Trema orientale TaxID=63057 RepID=A0A2P5AW21_TREOI|nr:hypothetical protein TorRG33x02_339630 [Trema orientale]
MLRIPSLILIRNTVNGDPHCVGVVLTFLILCLWNLEQLLLHNKLKNTVRPGPFKLGLIEP